MSRVYPYLPKNCLKNPNKKIMADIQLLLKNAKNFVLNIPVKDTFVLLTLNVMYDMISIHMI